MRKVISNTTPILSLLKINKLSILDELYGSVSIPQAVFDEIESGSDKEFYADLSKIPWISIEKIHVSTPKLYMFDLDAGEAEVLILAEEQNADLVVLDEIMGRRYAKHLGLNLTGTLGVLLKAKEQGLIDAISPLLDELIQKGTWLNPKIINDVLKLAGEK
jgi:predicted nucleic acid-binding protein